MSRLPQKKMARNRFSISRAFCRRFVLGDVRDQQTHAATHVVSDRRWQRERIGVDDRPDRDPRTAVEVGRDHHSGDSARSIAPVAGRSSPFRSCFQSDERRLL